MHQHPVGSLQLMLGPRPDQGLVPLDRDRIEATISVLLFYLLVVHTINDGERSFLNRELLKSPNFVAAAS